MSLPDKQIDALIGCEGGYTNNPADRGGETIFGITVAVARAYGYTGPMRDMPRATAVAIYQSRYWTQPRFDQIDAIDSTLALKLFDIGVNMGQGTGIKFMQRALNVLNNQGRAFPDIAVDGGIGPMTLAALKAFYAQRGADGHRVLLGMVTALQSVYIERLDWRECVARYDRPYTFFYLDPPYLGTEGYGVPFTLDDFVKIAEVMGRLSDKAILSVGDREDIRDVFSAFQHEVLEIDYTVGGADRRARRRELIIYSWDREAEPAGLF